MPKPMRPLAWYHYNAEAGRNIKNQLRNEANDRRYHEENLKFQQDGAPPHYALLVCQFLWESFLGRWIGRVAMRTGRVLFVE